MKKIGIMGGMGPESTIVFYQEIIRYCQEMYGAKYDYDYPEMFICNLPIPDVVESIENKDEIASALSNAAKRLEVVGMDFIVIPCNTAYLFFRDIQKSVSIPILNIIEETVKKVASRGYKKVGLLATEATINNKLYDRWFKRYNIEFIIPGESEKKELTRIIMNILSGKKLPEDRESLKGIINNLATGGAGGVVLGCTDLPVLIKEEDVEIELFDTIKILAESTIKYAMKNNISKTL